MNLYKIIKENFELIKIAPLRSTLGFLLLAPSLFFSMAIIFMLGGMALEIFSNFLFFGFSGLDRKFEWEFFTI